MKDAIACTIAKDASNRSPRAAFVFTSLCFLEDKVLLSGCADCTIPAAMFIYLSKKPEISCFGAIG